MGRDRYHYDRRGRYKGKSSDKGPYAGRGTLIVIAIIAFILIKGCH